MTTRSMTGTAAAATQAPTPSPAAGAASPTKAAGGASGLPNTGGAPLSEQAGVTGLIFAILLVAAGATFVAYSRSR